MRGVGDDPRDRTRGRHRCDQVGLPRRDCDAAEERPYQDDPHQPELSERLQRKRMRVLGEVVDRPVAQPPNRPAAGADAVQRLSRKRPQGHAPVRVTIALKCHEPARAGTQPLVRALLRPDHDRERQTGAEQN